MRQVQAVQEEYRALGVTVPQIRWMIEELRVSYFAQTRGTAYPISDKRIYPAIDSL